MNRTRREFLADVGKSALIAGLGTGAAGGLGIGSAFAEKGPEELSFGAREPLVRLMQETPADKLLPILAERLAQGVELKEITAAAALANARTFGGEDYIGFHTMMALAPAYRMAQELPTPRRALPVLKVIHRNAARIQAVGGRKKEVLHPVAPAEVPAGRAGGEVLLEAVRKKDVNGAEAAFASLARGKPEDAFNDVLFLVQDGQEVHRVVMPYRAWDLLDILGREQAHTMLRQSVRYCTKQESPRYSGYFAGARALLPKLLDQHKLLEPRKADRAADDDVVGKWADDIFRASPEHAAGIAAELLGQGFAFDDIGQAICLAANQLTLRDAGRTDREVQPNKPAGSVHGDSIGVHACDSANAWRNMAKLGNPRNRAACLILGAYQVAKDRGDRGGDFSNWQPYPRAEHLAGVKATDADGLLREADDAIKGNDQARAAAAVVRHAELGAPVRAAFDLLLGHAVSQDGALHAEKYYRTVVEEFETSRPKFRVRQLAALARVVASGHGYAAPGYADACKLLKV